MASGRSDVTGIGLDRIESEQVVNAQATINALAKQFVRLAKLGDTTPSVMNVERLEFRNTAPVLVTAFDEGQNGQRLEILGDGNTTIENNAKIVTASGANLLLDAGVFFTFTRFTDGIWHQNAAGSGGGGGGGGVTTFAGRSGAVVPVATDYTPAFIGAVPVSHLTDPDPHTQYELDANKGVANGYAPLDATAKVPAANLPASAAAPDWVTYHVDTPPASPVLFGGVNYDLEFKAGYTGLGTAFGSPTLAASIVNRSLRISSNLTAANTFVGQEYPCPSTAFVMTVKFRRRFQLEQYSVAHIGIRGNASGAGRMTQLLQVHRNTGTWDETDGSVENWTDETTGGILSINDNTPLPTIPAWYYRIEYTGTNVNYYWSMDGEDDNFRLFVTQTVAAALNSATPGRCFFGARGLNATFRAAVYIDWVRFK